MAISFSQYGEWLGGHKTGGRARKAESDNLMLWSWDEDI